MLNQIVSSIDKIYEEGFPKYATLRKRYFRRVAYLCFYQENLSENFIFNWIVRGTAHCWFISDNFAKQNIF